MVMMMMVILIIIMMMTLKDELLSVALELKVLTLSSILKSLSMRYRKVDLFFPHATSLSCY